MTAGRPRHFTDLNLFVGRKCNAACAHCSVLSSPEATSRMSPRTLTAVTRMIADFSQLGSGGRVLVTGGEPLLFAQELAVLSKAARAHDLHFGIETNAFWAKTDAVATRLLERYAIDVLIISASAFHAAFVPPARVLTAYRTARALGLAAEVRIAHMPGQALPAQMASLAEAVAAEDLILEPVAAFGRAADMPGARVPFLAASDDPMLCPSDGPIVLETGRVDPCCGPLSALDGHALKMGNVGTADALATMASDPVFEFLHRNGVRAFIEVLEAEDLPSRHHLAQGDACSVCAAVASDPVLASTIGQMRASTPSAAPRHIQQA